MKHAGWRTDLFVESIIYGFALCVAEVVVTKVSERLWPEEEEEEVVKPKRRRKRKPAPKPESRR